MSDDVLIVGAGPAGLVASINLARQGFHVTVAEQEQQVGGNPRWHPSAHTTPVRMPAIWKYIGVDCSSSFHDVSEKMTVVVSGKHMPMGKTPHPTFVCERGSRKTSLDSALYGNAVEAGVRFDFGRTVDENELKNAPKHTILATGLTPAMYGLLDRPMSRYLGYHAFCDHPEDKAEAAIYFGGLGKEYGYSSACNGIWYVLLFSRNELPKENLDFFNGLLSKFEDKQITEWRRFSGATPKAMPQLFCRDRFILTGTLAGFIETNLGFGITGALVSGKIAAMAVTDREGGQAQFDRFTKGIPAMIEKKKQGKAGLGYQLGEVWFDI